MFAQAWAEIKIFESFWKKVIYVFSLVVFFNFLPLSSPFFPVLIFLLQSLTFYWAYFQFKKFKKASSRRTILHDHGVVTCGRKKFCSVFFTQISGHFHAYFRLHWADLSDLGIIGKIFSSCRSWVQMMPMLVKTDDVRSGTKAKARHGLLKHKGSRIDSHLI